MPELPEVETTKRGVAPYLLNESITKIDIHHRSLRYPVEDAILLMENQTITDVTRRAKYLMIHTAGFYLIVHLGMSGSLRVSLPDEPLKKHDHLVFHLSNGRELRYHDPRRFGFVQLFQGDVTPDYLTKLAPEPLSDEFNVDYFQSIIVRKKQPIKAFLMDQHFVVGVGNIYANESLFMSGIHPLTSTQDLTQVQCTTLVSNIRAVLARSIQDGGTTLRDFIQPDGTHGYFAQMLSVYGREGEPCLTCGTLIEKCVVAQRSTFWCPNCQPKQD